MEDDSPETSIFFTPGDMMHHLFCPRFTYFDKVLLIPENTQRRWKVQQGKKIHETKAKDNTEYLRKKLGVIDKKINVWLESPRFHLRGIVDEVLLLDDGSAAPLDYKYAEWKGSVYKVLRAQSVIYGFLIAECFKKPVNRGYIIYTRSSNHLEELKFKNSDFKMVEEKLQEMLYVSQDGFFPDATEWKTRCPDCFYRNICEK